MENQESSKQNCDCSDGCCTPKKKNNLWRNLLFLIIILAVGTIVTIKLVGKNDAPPAKCCEKTETSANCSQSATPKDSTCCSEPKSAESSSYCPQPAAPKDSTCCSKSKNEK